jgi:hypothetical protein
MDGGQDLALGLAVDAVREPGEALVQLRPEGDAVGRRGWRSDRSQGGDVILPHPGAVASGLGECHLQPTGGCLAEADEHL